KSMVSEEIRLNQALEKAGLEVVEPDLGEFIIQLRGEPPSHIITPAVHLRRSDVAEIFQEKLGLPYTEDISALTAVARSVLRETFLKANVGISGVNFGIAENGMLCLVTNEGNGRMVTALPQVHIALMGIERILPTLDDLALMLYLLPRSATGQKLTVYTSLIRGPRREGEIDGSQERHLILVDNGRRRIRSSPLAESLYCIRCGACLNACPVFREIGGHAYVGVGGQITTYPGPIGSVVSPGLFGGADFGQLARASSLCGACKEACPVHIDLPKLLLRVRAGLVEGKESIGANIGDEGVYPSAPGHVPGGLRFGLSLFTWIATSPRRFTAAQCMAGVFSRIFSPFSTWIRLPAFTGWGYSRDIPRPSAMNFRRWFSKEAQAMNIAETSELQPIPVSTAPSPFSPTTLSLSPLPNRPLIERFETELIALGGIFKLCLESHLPQIILELLQEQGVSSIQAWEEAELPAGLLGTLRAAGIRVNHKPVPSKQVGLTGALAGVAETGTLVLPSGAGRPQTASLLPEVHIAILKAEDIYETLQEVLELREVHQASAVDLISGPSRTADIEMTLTIGVHGPREVHVFCVE
ncbi:MAG: LUD domain-containing protein, partial [Anaerolineales bacterium]